MSITNTPNMNLVVPGVGTEIGPNYANEINNDLSILDAHNHTIGNGAPIPSSGLLINADLSMNDTNLISIRSLRLQDQGGVLSGGSDLACLYNNGGNLYFNDSSGNQIAITAAGGVAGSPGSIANLVSPASATYTAASKTFTWASGTSGKAAAMDNGSVTIRQTDTASANGITIQSPNALGSAYSLTLPSALPGALEYVSCDTSGNLGLVTADSIGSAMTSVGANAVRESTTKTTGTTVTAGNVALSLSSGAFSVTGNTETQVTNFSVTITTVGKPIVIKLVPDGTATANSVSSSANTTGCQTTLNCYFGTISMGTLIGSLTLSSTTTGTVTAVTVPPGGFEWYDVGRSAGANTYTMSILGSSVTTSSVTRCKMKVYEEN